MNQKKGVIRGICISPRRGTAKYPVETAKIVPDWGIEEDAHGGKRLKHSGKRERM